MRRRISLESVPTDKSLIHLKDRESEDLSISYSEGTKAITGEQHAYVLPRFLKSINEASADEKNLIIAQQHPQHSHFKSLLRELQTLASPNFIVNHAVKN